MNHLRRDRAEYEAGAEAAERGEPRNCWWLIGDARDAWVAGFDSRAARRFGDDGTSFIEQLLDDIWNAESDAEARRLLNGNIAALTDQEYDDAVIAVNGRAEQLAKLRKAGDE